MINRIQAFITQIAERIPLSEEEAAHAFQIIMNGGATPAQIAALLMGMRLKGETVDEIAGAARAMRARMVTLKGHENAIDVCGTGGDGKDTLNVSTAAAIVVAACGVPVAKHGNRSVSSLSGSADVLRLLEVNIDAPVAATQKSLRECHIGFMFAPLFHPAMRHVAPIRQELGLRTIFNLLGPLCNPASPKRQLVGVYESRWTEPLAHVLHRLGSEKAWVVHGADGLDELSLSGPSQVTELVNGKVRTFTIEPQDAGLEIQPLQAIQAHSPQENAKALTHLLTGAKNAYRDVVLLNAAAALVVAGKALDLKEGVEIAAQAVDSGKAKETLAKLVYITNEHILRED